MKKIYTYKIFTIFLLTLLSLLIFSNSSFATSATDLSDVDIKLMVQRGYDLIEENGYNSKEFTKYYIDSDRVCYFTDNSNINCINWLGRNLLKVSNNCTVKFDLDTLEAKEFGNNMENQISSTWDISYVDSIVFSTFDIYKGDTIVFEKNIDFFRVAPQPMAEIMLVELKEKETTKEILGILPLILVVVVSFLGLRKALSWLWTLLRGC